MLSLSLSGDDSDKKSKYGEEGGGEAEFQLVGNLVAKTSQNIAFHLRLSEAVDNAGLGNEEHRDKPDVIWHQQQQGSQGHRMDSPNPDNYHNWLPHSAWETYFEAGNLCSCLSDICEGRE